MNVLPAEQQPASTDLRMANGVFCKTIVLQAAGIGVPQHVHEFPHVTVVVRGGIRAWRGNTRLGDFLAPVGITIAAHVKHTFVSLRPNTVLLCVHDIRGAEAVAIEAEHQIDEGAR
jgi:hypothetical protein